MKVSVEYDAPVSAVVDTETGRVERVVVWCDHLIQRDDEYGVITADEREQPVSEDLRQEAQVIVDSTMWPAWDFG